MSFSSNRNASDEGNGETKISKLDGQAYPWIRNFDADSGEYYYSNIDTFETQWAEPPGWGDHHLKRNFQALFAVLFFQRLYRRSKIRTAPGEYDPNLDEGDSFAMCPSCYTRNLVPDEPRASIFKCSHCQHPVRSPIQQNKIPGNLIDFQNLEKELKLLCTTKKLLNDLWLKLDDDGSCRATLRELGRILEKQFPLLRDKVALDFAYIETCGIVEGGTSQGDKWVLKKDFVKLLHNILYFTKSRKLCSAAGIRTNEPMNLFSFTRAVNHLGIELFPAQVKSEFMKLDIKNGASEAIPFESFSVWVASQDPIEGFTPESAIAAEAARIALEASLAVIEASDTSDRLIGAVEENVDTLQAKIDIKKADIVEKAEKEAKEMQDHFDKVQKERKAELRQLTADEIAFDRDQQLHNERQKARAQARVRAAAHARQEYADALVKEASMRLEAIENASAIRAKQRNESINIIEAESNTLEVDAGTLGEEEMNTLMIEYLKYYNLDASVEVFARESVHVSSNAEMKAENSGNPILIVTVMLQAFEEGNDERFFRMWAKHLSKFVVNTTESLELEFNVRVHFALFQSTVEVKITPANTLGSGSSARMMRFRSYIKNRGQQVAYASENTDFVEYIKLPDSHDPRNDPRFSKSKIFLADYREELKRRLKTFLVNKVERPQKPELKQMHETVQNSAKDLQMFYEGGADAIDLVKQIGVEGVSHMTLWSELLNIQTRLGLPGEIGQIKLELRDSNSHRRFELLTTLHKQIKTVEPKMRTELLWRWVQADLFEIKDSAILNPPRCIDRLLADSGGSGIVCAATLQLLSAMIQYPQGKKYIETSSMICVKSVCAAIIHGSHSLSSSFCYFAVEFLFRSAFHVQTGKFCFRIMKWVAAMLYQCMNVNISQSSAAFAPRITIYTLGLLWNILANTGNSEILDDALENSLVASLSKLIRGVGVAQNSKKFEPLPHNTIIIGCVSLYLIFDRGDRFEVPQDANIKEFIKNLLIENVNVYPVSQKNNDKDLYSNFVAHLEEIHQEKPETHRSQKTDIVDYGLEFMASFDNNIVSYPKPKLQWRNIFPGGQKLSVKWQDNFKIAQQVANRTGADNIVWSCKLCGLEIPIECAQTDKNCCEICLLETEDTKQEMASSSSSKKGVKDEKDIFEEMIYDAMEKASFENNFSQHYSSGKDVRFPEELSKLADSMGVKLDNIPSEYEFKDDDTELQGVTTLSTSMWKCAKCQLRIPRNIAQKGLYCNMCSAEECSVNETMTQTHRSQRQKGLGIANYARKELSYSRLLDRHHKRQIEDIHILGLKANIQWYCLDCQLKVPLSLRPQNIAGKCSLCNGKEKDTQKSIAEKERQNRKYLTQKEFIKAMKVESVDAFRKRLTETEAHAQTSQQTIMEKYNSQINFMRFPRDDKKLREEAEKQLKRKLQKQMLPEKRIVQVKFSLNKSIDDKKIISVDSYVSFRIGLKGTTFSEKPMNSEKQGLNIFLEQIVFVPIMHDLEEKDLGLHVIVRKENDVAQNIKLFEYEIGISTNTIENQWTEEVFDVNSELIKDITIAWSMKPKLDISASKETLEVIIPEGPSGIVWRSYFDTITVVSNFQRNLFGERGAAEQSGIVKPGLILKCVDNIDVSRMPFSDIMTLLQAHEDRARKLYFITADATMKTIMLLEARKLGRAATKVQAVVRGRAMRVLRPPKASKIISNVVIIPRGESGIIFENIHPSNRVGVRVQGFVTVLGRKAKAESSGRIKIGMLLEKIDKTNVRCMDVEEIRMILYSRRNKLKRTLCFIGKGIDSPILAERVNKVSAEEDVAVKKVSAEEDVAVNKVSAEEDVAVKTQSNGELSEDISSLIESIATEGGALYASDERSPDIKKETI